MQTITVNLTPEIRLDQALETEAGIDDLASVTKLTILGTLKGYDVQFIRENMSDTLQELFMSNALVDQIRHFSFAGCTALRYITLPNSDVNIGNRSFLGCSALKSISVHPDNPLYTSEKGILYSKDKTKIIVFPQSRQGDYMIPKFLKKIDDFKLRSCNDLTFVTAHPDNPAYTTKDSVLFNKDKTELIFFPNWRHDDNNEYVIHYRVKKIGSYAFFGCTGLTSVTIPCSVIEIGMNAFAGCTNIKSFFIPESVVEIDESSFDSTATVHVHLDNPDYTSKNGRLMKKEKFAPGVRLNWRDGTWSIMARHSFQEIAEEFGIEKKVSSFDELLDSLNELFLEDTTGATAMRIIQEDWRLVSQSKDSENTGFSGFL
jgi:hypothetical protein